jgi:two-component system cell cycle response regulator
MCDIDHFKIVNDTYGHPCGDEVLKKFVQSISELIRHDSDWVSRYGGEEFLLVLPETKLDNAFKLADRLRQHLAQKVIETDEEKISITASFGVTGFNASNARGPITADALINRVDRYLYEAKTQGRNRVVCGPFS